MLRRIKIKPNYLIPFTSTTIVMVILGFLAASFIFSGELVKWLKENTDIAIELRQNVSADDVKKIKSLLTEDERVLENSIKHLPPAEAVYLLGLDYEQTAWWSEDDVPFQDMVIFNLKADYFEPAILNELSRHYKKNVNSISEIHYQDRLVLDFHSNLEYFAFWFSGFGLLFLFLSVVLIYNTTKLALYADRMEIETMELVGASRAFIRKPYLLKSFFLGLISGLIAILLIGLVVSLLTDDALGLITEDRRELALMMMVGLPLSGGVFCLFCTWLTLNQYLKYR
ncbi:MAG: FtsX-like permease family protein [Saprospirales bacterium]|nr:MAG: FtsX-like permease family protein [Saprospirales bacterium]